MEVGDRSAHPYLFFSAEEERQIVAAIGAAELYTSGEIRIHMEGKARRDILQQATEAFEKLGMTKTAGQSGVLIFFCLQSRRFAVIGDSGIHEKVSDTFWKDIAKEMEHHFRENRFAEGLISGIRKIGEALQKEFPYQSDDINELPDAISYSL